MKRIATIISVLAVSTLFSAIGIMADEYSPEQNGDDYGNQMSPPVKNECLLVAKNCANQYESVTDRIIDLRKEISKGLDVYTPSELNSLNDQLDFLQSETGVDNTM